MKALVGAFNQEKALVGAFSVIVQPVVEPMDRFTALSRFLVQGLMKYTGPGHDATIEITTTSDVQAKLSVVTAETTREPEADNPESEYMVATTVRTGSVELVNNKEEAVKCKVEHSLQGQLAASDPAYKDKIERSQGRLHGLNPSAKYIWELELEPKQRKKITMKIIWKDRIHAGKKAKGAFGVQY